MVPFKTGVHDGLLTTRQPVCGELFGGAFSKGGNEKGCECDNSSNHLGTLC